MAGTEGSACAGRNLDVRILSAAYGQHCTRPYPLSTEWTTAVERRATRVSINNILLISSGG